MKYNSCITLLKKYSKYIDVKFNIITKSCYIDNIYIKGPLGILQKNLSKKIIWLNWNSCINLGLKFNILWNLLYKTKINDSLIISNNMLGIFIKDFEKLIIGVLYGWYISFSIFGRGFSFRLLKRANIKYLKLKIGYSHFIYYKLPFDVWVKISKKKNKLFIFCLDFWKLQKLSTQIRNIRSSHVYKVQGITFLNEIIKLKPGKQKQV